MLPIHRTKLSIDVSRDFDGEIEATLQLHGLSRKRQIYILLWPPVPAGLAMYSVHLAYIISNWVEPTAFIYFYGEDEMRHTSSWKQLPCAVAMEVVSSPY